MDIKNLNTITSAKSDIYPKLLDLIANGNYLTTESENFDTVDILKSSTIGYVTEALAMILRNESFHKTMIYRESSPNTAVTPKSIYGFAKMFNVNVIDAVPSGRYATIRINISDIENTISNNKLSISDYQKKFGITENSNFIILDKSNPIIAGEYYFSMEHSVEIYKNNTGKYIVKYCLNELDKTTSYGNYTTPVINTRTEVYNGNVCLSFDVKVYQYRIVETSKIITSSSFLDTHVHTFSYTGQICGLSLQYIKNNNTENVNLQFSNLYSTTDESTTKTAYYDLADDHAIEINFGTNKTAGLPQPGGTLLLKTFITEGSAGNISYSGDAYMVLQEEDFKSLVITAKLNSNILTSGEDQSSLQDIKSIIKNKLSSRNTIITENDLNVWFDTQSKLLEDINNSKITFRKEKDNLLRRSFSAYLLLRDGVSLNDYLEKNQDATKSTSSYISNVVPTNTIDIDYSVVGQSVDSTGIIDIDPTTTFSYNSESSKYEVGLPEGSSDFEFNTPFNIQINTEYNNVSYFYTDTDDEATLSVEKASDLSNLSYTLIPTTVSVYKSSASANKDIAFRFNFTSDEDLSAKAISSLKFKFGSNTYNLSGTYSFISEENSDEEFKNYYIDIPFEENGFDTTASDIRIKMTETDNPQTMLVVPNSTIGLVVETSEYSISFISEKELQIFKSLEGTMSSDLHVVTNDNNEIIKYIIKDVPVVASYWMSSSLNKKWFIDQMLVFINMLNENSDRLETTTFFNIKFRNTYGFSKTYSSLLTTLRLKLKIYLKSDMINNFNYSNNVSDAKEELETTIRDFVRILVDQSNDEESLVISKIIMKVQSSFYDYIDHIDFAGLNGTFNQYIKKVNLSEQNVLKYPLEYFSLDNTIVTDDNGIKRSRLEEDITFETI